MDYLMAIDSSPTRLKSVMYDLDGEIVSSLASRAWKFPVFPD